MKRVNIKCPVCEAQAQLRPASVVYGPRAVDPEAKLYICSRYPACDCYVTAHRKTGLPMGTLAHAALEDLMKTSGMTRKEAYRWLQVQFGLPAEDAHIAKFSELRCQAVVSLCTSMARPSQPVA